MNVEVPYHQERDVEGREKGFRGDRVDSVVTRIAGVGIYEPK